MEEEQRRRHAVVDASDDERVSEWEAGLPDRDELTPLSQTLIPRDLASAFSLPPEPYRTQNDVARASENTISALSIIRSRAPFQPKNSNTPPPETGAATMLIMEEDAGADSRKSRRMDTAEEADSAEDQSSARALKRPRLVWTPQLHKRFVEVVSHLGLNNAVPKTIMQMMNVDGLTRENVASHLQKYRLYLKRQSEGSAPSDHVLTSEPYPHHLHQQHQPPRPVMPVINPLSYNTFDSHHHFSIMQQHQQRDWSSANNYASLASHAND